MFYGYLTANGDGQGRMMQVREDRMRRLLLDALATVEVDEAWYRLTNPDVENEIQAGRLASGRDHYMNHGYFEDRFPRAIVVDVNWYLSKYLDVRAAIEAGVYFTAQHHFSTSGFREGLLPYEGFTLFGTRRAV